MKILSSRINLCWLFFVLLQNKKVCWGSFYVQKNTETFWKIPSVQKKERANYYYSFQVTMSVKCKSPYTMRLWFQPQRFHKLANHIIKQWLNLISLTTSPLIRTHKWGWIIIKFSWSTKTIQSFPKSLIPFNLSQRSAVTVIKAWSLTAVVRSLSLLHPLSSYTHLHASDVHIIYHQNLCKHDQLKVSVREEFVPHVAKHTHTLLFTNLLIHTARVIHL